MTEYRQIFLARHGETDWNVCHRRQGWFDSPLTSRGLEQVKRSASLMRSQSIDLVFSSPLGRALATAQIHAHEVGTRVVVVDELAEIHHGQFTGLTDAEISSRYPDAMRQRDKNKYGWRFPDGESYADADRRAGIALQRIAESASERPLIVSHEMIGRMLLRNLLDLDSYAALKYRHAHETVYMVEMQAKTLKEIR